MKTHHHHRLKSFAGRLASGAVKFGRALDTGVGHAHRVVSSVSPEFVESVGGPEAGLAVRYAKNALGAYEGIRTAVAGRRG